MMGDGIGEGQLLHIRVWVGGTGGRYYLLVCFLCLFLFVLLSFGLSCPVSFLSE